MPTGNLPEEARKLFLTVEDAAKKGTCKGRDDIDACAAKIAWSAVKKQYKKVGDKWVKRKSALQQFSMAIVKTSFDKKTNQMRWRAVASDTEEDLYHDEMSMELFSSFIRRIESNEPAPDIVRSKFWSGGMPYLSVSHYPDLDGMAVPGTIEAVYIDGNRLKSWGTFSDTPLGNACFKAVNKDLYGDSEQKNKVRISIAFIDYKHEHKSNGYIFERKSLDDMCPECFAEILDSMVNGTEPKGKRFLDGHLVHEAMTRVPVNERTMMEVERSMDIKTRKEDAASIIGEELAEEIEEKAKKILETESLVIKADVDDKVPEEEDVVETKAKTKTVDGKPRPAGDFLVVEDPDKPSTWHLPVKVNGKPDHKLMAAARAALTAPGGHRGKKYEGPDKAAALKKLKALYKSEGMEWEHKAEKSIPEMIEELRELIAVPEPHPLDEAFAQVKARYDEVVGTDKEQALVAIQEPFDALGEVIRSKITEAVPQTEKNIEERAQEDLTSAFSKALEPVIKQLSLLEAQLDMLKKSAPSTQQVVPTRRSVQPSMVISPQNLSAPRVKSSTPNLRKIVDRSVGIR